MQSIENVTQEKITWTVGDVIKALLLLYPLAGFTVLLIYVAVSLIILLIYGAGNFVNIFRTASRPEYVAIVSMGIAVFLASLLLVWYFGIRKRKARWEDLGFRSSGGWFDLPLVLFGEIAILLGINFYANFIYFFARLKVPEQPVVELFGRSQSGFFLALVLIVFFAPIGEELFFRGFVYSALAKRWGRWWGLILSAAIFGIFHIRLLFFFPMFLIGLVLAGIFEYRKSLLPSIYLHALNNFLALLYAYVR